jgi:hypothetical protein
MLSYNSRIPKFQKRSGSLQPVLPLIPLKLASAEDEKGKFISFELMTRVGQPATGTKYKKQVRKFEEGTPQQWIDFLRDLQEIWTQNSINGGTDRASTVRAVVKGESITAFETSLQEARTDEAGVVANMTSDHVDTALTSVATTVFPHRALEIQKLWMNRRMFKPAELTTRQTAAAITRLNNALPLFPLGTDASKFSDSEIIGLLEWSLPPAWRTKFDLDGYIPTLQTKAKLIENCEAIERNASHEEKSPSSNDKNGKQQKKKRKNENGSTDHPKGDRSNKTFYCSEHGKNPTHATGDCFTLKNREKSGSQGGNRTFSNKSFRKEVNFLAKKSSKKKVLDMYATAIKREQKKMQKQVAKRKPREVASSDSDSDDDISISNIEPAKARKPSIKSSTRTTDERSATKAKTRTTDERAIARKRRAQQAALKQEEDEYQKKLLWLADHGESDKDETVDGQDETVDEQTDTDSS